jgi:catechol 2,3-dioxygenase-like lactoylglutathione lyase family enzyme
VSANDATRGLHHLLLQTTELERAERFFLDFLGFTVRNRGEFTDGRPLTVTNEGLGLTSGGPDTAGAVEHIAFRFSNIREIARRAHEEGVTVYKDVGPGVYGLTVYLGDPDGNRIELFAEDET